MPNMLLSPSNELPAQYWPDPQDPVSETWIRTARLAAEQDLAIEPGVLIRDVSHPCLSSLRNTHGWLVVATLRPASLEPDNLLTLAALNMCRTVMPLDLRACREFLCRAPTLVSPADSGDRPTQRLARLLRETHDKIEAMYAARDCQRIEKDLMGLDDIANRERLSAAARLREIERELSVLERQLGSTAQRPEAIQAVREKLNELRSKRDAAREYRASAGAFAERQRRDKERYFTKTATLLRKTETLLTVRWRIR